MKLSKLEKVDLREIWKGEATDFTPWLAKENNIDLLGETLGIDLELVNQEKSVGPFRADILCKDMNNHYVLIENQLEKTDHAHLGQLMTYAAGLDAVTIIWISREFTEEHRAAIDWLNTITDDGINFFAIEIKLFKIGESAPAPMFDVVAKPNDWTKTVKSRVSNEKATPTELLRFDYWTALKEYLSNVPTFLKPQKPSTQHWTYFALGKSNFVLSVVISVTKKFIRVEFDIQDDRDKSIINELRLKYEAESKSSIDESIVWDGIEGKKMSWAYLVKDFDVTNRNKWTEQFEWIRDNVEKFDRFFRPIVKKR